jgi:hypothetical protein
VLFEKAHDGVPDHPCRRDVICGRKSFEAGMSVFREAYRSANGIGMLLPGNHGVSLPDACCTTSASIRCRMHHIWVDSQTSPQHLDFVVEVVD